MIIGFVIIQVKPIERVWRWSSLQNHVSLVQFVTDIMFHQLWWLKTINVRCTIWLQYWQNTIYKSNRQQYKLYFLWVLFCVIDEIKHQWEKTDGITTTLHICKTRQLHHLTIWHIALFHISHTGFNTGDHPTEHLPVFLHLLSVAICSNYTALSYCFHVW